MSIGLCSYLYTSTNCLDYCNCIMKLEIRKSESSKSFHFNTLLDIEVPFSAIWISGSAFPFLEVGNPLEFWSGLHRIWNFIPKYFVHLFAYSFSCFYNCNWSLNFLWRLFVCSIEQYSCLFLVVMKVLQFSNMCS